ncbi:hypothetical protein BSZ19_12245 [Bradyrhizobium japonicum]|uniref:Uncharacterized protein n=1 Tax=Bradyrhizobium japonicum TaxID=375 RepID=A0A1Y2JV82_BRAJP|nr:hypothetical protein BSZ19_12245 [Bradyrhizobium japonicum]
MYGSYRLPVSAMVSRTKARSHALARVHEERSSIRRAEECCSCASADGVSRFDGVETAHVMGRLYAAAGLYSTSFSRRSS